MEFPGQTAAMLDPFKNSLKRGQLLIDPATFPKLVEAAEQRGWIVHMHAVGDRAVREGLNAVANARQLSPAPVPHSISHLQTVNPKEFPRFRELGVIASMQLLWATAETYTEELVKPYVSAMAYQYQYPARSLNKAGATIAGASDWPVSSPNPWNAIAQASTRKGPLGVLNAAESIDRQNMFQAYTLNAAQGSASGAAHRLHRPGQAGRPDRAGSRCIHGQRCRTVRHPGRDHLLRRQTGVPGPDR